MKSIKFLLPFICIPFMYGCGKVDGYLGVYRLSTAVEEQWYHYWSEPEKQTGSKQLGGIGTVIHINKDKSVDYRLGTETKKSKINCYKDYCTFSNLPISKSYKFTMQQTDEGKKLSYYNRSKNTGFVYDFTKTYVIFEEYLDPADFNNHIGTYTIYKSTHEETIYNGMEVESTTLDEDYQQFTNKRLTINSDKTFKINDVNKGTLTFDNFKITFSFNDSSFLVTFPMNELFVSNKTIYIQGNKTYTEPIPTTIKRKEHKFAFYLKR